MMLASDRYSDSQGAFDSFQHEHLPRTKYDQIVDETSNKPGEQAFEVSCYISFQKDPITHILQTETHFWPLSWRNFTLGHLRAH